MYIKPKMLALILLAAFGGGMFSLPLLHLAAGAAHAEPAPLSAQVIDLAPIRHSDLPATSNPEMNAKGLVATEYATISLQSGNVAKHMHPKTDEIQYIVEGSGAMWLGNERKEFRPGSLIIIPKGIAHAGTLVSNGPVKAIAIKIPPQGKDDIVFLN